MTSSLEVLQDDVAPNEVLHMHVFPSYGRLDKDMTEWIVDVCGWALIERPTSFRRNLVLGVLGAFGEQSNERAKHFLSRPLQSNSIKLHLLNNESSEILGEQVEAEITVNGHFNGQLRLPVDLFPPTETHFLRAVALKSIGAYKGQSAEASVVMIPPTGVSVISDLDDTIKESDVHLGKRAAFKTAMYGESIAVPGMSEAYRFYQGKSMAIHYVSASPYQLLPTLKDFLGTNDFPPGSLHLRDVWASMSSRAYKTSVITTILEHFPNRKFVLIGDAGEKDAETFTTLLKSHPEQIIKFYIRNVTGLGRGGIKRDDLDARATSQLTFVTSATSEITPDKWMLFENSEQLLLDDTLLSAIH